MDYEVCTTCGGYGETRSPDGINGELISVDYCYDCNGNGARAKRIYRHTHDLTFAMKRAIEAFEKAVRISITNEYKRD